MPDQALMLIPGVNCTASLFMHQMAAMGEGRALLIPDHRSDASIERIALRALAAAPSRFALCGLSMGGYIALEIMRIAPARVTRLALLDTRCRADTQEDGERRGRLAELADSGRFDDVHGILWQKLVHPSRLADSGLEALVKGMMRETGALAFSRQQHAVRQRRDYSDILPSIKVPTLVLVGEADQITPPEHSREMAAAIANSTMVTIASCGHLATLEAPEAVNMALKEWMQREEHGA